MDDKVGSGAVAGALSFGSLKFRHVDCGSCNGCEIELAGCFSSLFDLERFGVALVASPRHADGILVTGVVTENMLEPLVRSYEAVPGPKITVALGDCAIGVGDLQLGYAVAGVVSDFVPVDYEIPGCPPDPRAIIDALRRAANR